MKLLDIPNADIGGTPIFNVGDGDFEYELAAGVPLRFPVAADTPHGGAFLIRVPAGSDVRLKTSVGSPGYPVDGLAHCVLAFDAAEIVELVSAAGATINILQHRER